MASRWTPIPILPVILLTVANPTFCFVQNANLGRINLKVNPNEAPTLLLELHSTTIRRRPSRITDDGGLIPDPPEAEFEDVGEIVELHEVEDDSEMLPGPIPHQLWRRGETNGCEDPITEQWRTEAEDVMAKAAKLVGAHVIDITWFLTHVIITLHEDLSEAQDLLKASGPVIEIKHESKPLFYDPEDANPEPIWSDREDIVYQRETEVEAGERKQRKRNMYAKAGRNDPENEPHIPHGEDDADSILLYMNEETRADAAYTEALEVKARWDEEEKPGTFHLVDTAALSTIAGAIVEALEDVEQDLQILSRHELVLAGPGPPDILETQKQFDAHRGKLVIVETQDPWQSNRILRGKLLDRNSMDVLINKRGRMVTVPLNFVKCVKVEPPEGGSQYHLVNEGECKIV